MEHKTKPENSHNHDPNTLGTEQSRTMFFIFVITTGFMFIEFFVGILIHSLALISDSGHMLNDVFSIGLGLIGIRLVMRGSDPKRTYGFNRIEVLFGFIQGLSLLGVSTVIIIQAIQRFQSLQTLEIQGGLMLVVAIIGLLVNLLGIKLLHGHHEENLNVSGVYYHIIADTLGSLAAIIAGTFIFIFQWYWMDLLVSFLISILIFQQGLKITWNASRILLEETPSHIDLETLMNEIQGITGVKQITDIHAWSITPSFHILTAHVIIEENVAQPLILKLAREISQKYGFKHCTFQLEYEPCENFPECYPKQNHNHNQNQDTP